MSHENAKYDPDLNNVEKKIQIEDFYKQKEHQTDNNYIHMHKDALNNISNKGIQQSQSTKALKTEEISILHNSHSTLNEAKTSRMQKQYSSGNSNQRVLTEGAESSPTQRKSQTFNHTFQLSNLPISRKDVKDLEYWLGDMINNLLEQRDLPKQKLLDGFQVIYTACLKELIRQVKISCVERGTLFEKVWIAYNDLILKGQSANEQYHKQQEQEFLDEMTRVHKAYKQQIDLIEEEKKKDKDRLEQQNKDIQILSETTNYFKKKLLNADLEVKKHKKMEEDLRAQLEAVIQEKLKLKLLNSEQKKSEDSQSPPPLQSHRMKSSRFRTEKQNSNNQLSNREHEEDDKGGLKEEISPSNVNEEENDETPAYMHKITHIDSDDETKEEFKNSKISVVSHLLNRKNLIFGQDDGPQTEREELDQMFEEYKNQIHQNSQQELDELIEQEANEEKREKLKDSNEEPYELKEKEVQTDFIQLSDCEQINILIHQLTQFGKINSNQNIGVNNNLIKLDQMKGGDNSTLVPQYEEALEILKTGETSLDSKLVVMNALKNALKQMDAYIKMGETLSNIAKDNIKLQNEKFDLEIKSKETQVEAEQTRNKYNKLIMRFGQKDNMISELEEQLQNVHEERKQDKKNLKVLFKGMVKHAIQSKHRIEGEQPENQKGDEDQNVENNQQQDENDQREDQNYGDSDKDDNSSSSDEDNDLGGSNKISEFLIGVIETSEKDNKLKQASLFVGDDIQKETKEGSSIHDIINRLMGTKFEQMRLSKNMSNRGGSVTQQKSPSNTFMRASTKARPSDDFRKKVIQSTMKMSLTSSTKMSNLLASVVNENKQSADPSLNQSKNVQRRFYSPNQEYSQKIINQIQQQKEKITKPELPMNTVVKFLSCVIQEVIKNENGFRIPLYTFCYDNILQKYGLKTVAEKKLKQILRSLYCYRNSSSRLKSCSMYCGLLTAFDDTNYQMYIKSIKYFYDIQTNSICNVQDDVLIAFDKIISFIDDFFKEKLSLKDYQDLITNVKQIQQNPVIVNGQKENGLRFEEMISISLHYYELTKNECKKHVSEIFYACDLDKNDSIEFYEFDMMYKFVESERYDHGLIQKQFSEEADMMNPQTGERALSLSKFIDFCIEKDLFSKKKCEQFSQVQNTNDEIKTIDDLLQNWQYRFKLLKYRFLKCNQYKPHIKGIIDTLTEQLTNYDTKNAQIIWLSYRLIDQESINILVEHETKQIVENILPIKLQMLHIISTKFEEIL